MNIFKRGDTYRFHLRSGSFIDLKGVKNLKVNWNPATTSLLGWEAKLVHPRYNTLFHLVLGEVSAIEKR